MLLFFNGVILLYCFLGCIKDEVLVNFVRYYEKKDEILMELKDERFLWYVDEYKDRLMKECIYQIFI